jgi:hypothetical protein
MLAFIQRLRDEPALAAAILAAPRVQARVDGIRSGYTVTSSHQLLSGRQVWPGRCGQWPAPGETDDLLVVTSTSTARPRQPIRVMVTGPPPPRGVTEYMGLFKAGADSKRPLVMRPIQATPPDPSLAVAALGGAGADAHTEGCERAGPTAAPGDKAAAAAAAAAREPLQRPPPGPVAFRSAVLMAPKAPGAYDFRVFCSAAEDAVPVGRSAPVIVSVQGRDVPEALSYGHGTLLQVLVEAGLLRPQHAEEAAMRPQQQPQQQEGGGGGFGWERDRERERERGGGWKGRRGPAAGTGYRPGALAESLGIVLADGVGGTAGTSAASSLLGPGDVLMEAEELPGLLPRASGLVKEWEGLMEAQAYAQTRAHAQPGASAVAAGGGVQPPSVAVAEMSRLLGAVGQLRTLVSQVSHLPLQPTPELLAAAATASLGPPSLPPMPGAAAPGAGQTTVGYVPDAEVSAELWACLRDCRYAALLLSWAVDGSARSYLSLPQKRVPALPAGGAEPAAAAPSSVADLYGDALLPSLERAEEVLGRAFALSAAGQLLPGRPVEEAFAPHPQLEAGSTSPGGVGAAADAGAAAPGESSEEGAPGQQQQQQQQPLSALSFLTPQLRSVCRALLLQQPASGVRGAALPRSHLLASARTLASRVELLVQVCSEVAALLDEVLCTPGLRSALSPARLACVQAWRAAFDPVTDTLLPLPCDCGGGLARYLSAAQKAVAAAAAPSASAPGVAEPKFKASVAAARAAAAAAAPRFSLMLLQRALRCALEGTGHDGLARSPLLLLLQGDGCSVGSAQLFVPITAAHAAAALQAAAWHSLYVQAAEAEASLGEAHPLVTASASGNPSDVSPASVQAALRRLHRSLPLLSLEGVADMLAHLPSAALAFTGESTGASGRGAPGRVASSVAALSRLLGLRGMHALEEALRKAPAPGGIAIKAAAGGDAEPPTAHAEPAAPGSAAATPGRRVGGKRAAARREEVRSRVQAILAALPAAGVGEGAPQVAIFGSSVNGFASWEGGGDAEGGVEAAVDECDLDLALVFAPHSTEGKDAARREGADVGATTNAPAAPSGRRDPLRTPVLIEQAAALLEAAGMQGVVARSSARIPIVLFRDPATGLQCDLCAGNELAVRNSHLLHCYAEADPRLRRTVLAVKRWARSRQLNDPSAHTLSSYAWALLVLARLQRLGDQPLLPSLQALPPSWPLGPEEAAAALNGRAPGWAVSTSSTRSVGDNAAAGDAIGSGSSGVTLDTSSLAAGSGAAILDRLSKVLSPDELAARRSAAVAAVLSSAHDYTTAPDGASFDCYFWSPGQHPRLEEGAAMGSLRALATASAAPDASPAAALLLDFFWFYAFAFDHRRVVASVRPSEADRRAVATAFLQQHGLEEALGAVAAGGTATLSRDTPVVAPLPGLLPPGDPHRPTDRKTARAIASGWRGAFASSSYGLCVEDPFEGDYDVAHVLRPSTFRALKTDLAVTLLQVVAACRAADTLAPADADSRARAAEAVRAALFAAVSRNPFLQPRQRDAKVEGVPGAAASISVAATAAGERRGGGGPAGRGFGAQQPQPWSHAAQMQSYATHGPQQHLLQQQPQQQPHLHRPDHSEWGQGGGVLRGPAYGRHPAAAGPIAVARGHRGGGAEMEARAFAAEGWAPSRSGAAVSQGAGDGAYSAAPTPAGYGYPPYAAAVAPGGMSAVSHRGDHAAGAQAFAPTVPAWPPAAAFGAPADAARGRTDSGSHSFIHVEAGGEFAMRRGAAPHGSAWPSDVGASSRSSLPAPAAARVIQPSGAPQRHAAAAAAAYPGDSTPGACQYEGEPPHTSFADGSGHSQRYMIGADGSRRGAEGAGAAPLTHQPRGLGDHLHRGLLAAHALGQQQQLPYMPERADATRLHSHAAQSLAAPSRAYPGGADSQSSQLPSGASGSGHGSSSVAAAQQWSGESHFSPGVRGPLHVAGLPPAAGRPYDTRSAYQSSLDDVASAARQAIAFSSTSSGSTGNTRGAAAAGPGQPGGAPAGAAAAAAAAAAGGPQPLTSTGPSTPAKPAVPMARSTSDWSAGPDDEAASVVRGVFRTAMASPAGAGGAVGGGGYVGPPAAAASGMRPFSLAHGQ